MQNREIGDRCLILSILMIVFTVGIVWYLPTSVDAESLVNAVETDMFYKEHRTFTRMTEDSDKVIVKEAYTNKGYMAYEYVSLGTFTTTGYDACVQCCGNTLGITASGTHVHYDEDGETTCAVDTSVIPFGTRLLINGRVYVAEDRGSAVIGNHIDLYFPTHQEAFDYATQYVEVFVIQEVAYEGVC